MSAPAPMKTRWLALGAMALLYGASVLLGSYVLSGYRHASGVEDLGHRLVPPLELMVGRETAQYVFWLGTLPLELFFVGIVIAILLSGKGVRLGMCLYVAYFLHWLFLPASALPPPDHSVWQFPPGIFTLGRPYEKDFWFSGHTANAVLIALASRGTRAWLQWLAWSLVAFEILLVLATRTHYTIDVLGGIFVAYTIHRLSLDIAAKYAHH
jgi:hypothetical protein